MLAIKQSLWTLTGPPRVGFRPEGANDPRQNDGVIETGRPS